MKKMKLAVLLLLFTGVGASAAQFEIKEVVEVGPIYVGGMTEPIKWSPDGSQFAYFYEGHLYLADTNGHSIQSVAVELPPHRFEWLSDKEIVVSGWDWIDSRNRRFSLDKIDISESTVEKLDEFTSWLGTKSGEQRHEYTGPFKTVGGDLFCRVLRDYSQWSLELIQSKYRSVPDRLASQFLRVGEDALYLVNVVETDSTRISKRRYTSIDGLRLSGDRSWLAMGGTLIHLASDSVISLDTLTLPIPDGADGCGYVKTTFNSQGTEVVFTRTCDVGDFDMINSVGVFDLTSNTVTILDNLIGLSGCMNPGFSPDGDRITIVSSGIVYLIKRGKGDE